MSHLLNAMLNVLQNVQIMKIAILNISTLIWEYLLPSHTYISIYSQKSSRRELLFTHALRPRGRLRIHQKFSGGRGSFNLLSFMHLISASAAAHFTLHTEKILFSLGRVTDGVGHVGDLRLLARAWNWGQQVVFIQIEHLASVTNGTRFLMYCL